MLLAPDEQFTVDPNRLFHRNPGTPYDGRTLLGVVRQTWLRGDRSTAASPREAAPAQGPAMKLLVVNVNTSASMTAVIAESARRYASDGEIVALQPAFGADGVDCNFESYLAAVAVMDRVVTYEEPFDAVVLAGFGSTAAMVCRSSSNSLSSRSARRRPTRR